MSNMESTLTIIGDAPSRGRHRYVKVRCACGVEREVRFQHLEQGRVLTCGGDAHRVIPLGLRYSRAALKSRKAKPVFTYAIAAPAVGRIKIGRTRHPGTRFAALCAFSPVDLVQVAMVEGNHERALHLGLAVYRCHGEWFTDGPEVRAALARVLGC